MEIAPDLKDWTWVVDRPCPECGFNATLVKPPGIGDRVRRDLDRWVTVLERSTARDRPDPQTWSPTEYAAHVRDVFDVFCERIELVVLGDDPHFTSWDQDEAARAGDYAHENPSRVSHQLVARGRKVAAAFDAVPDDVWDRPGGRSNGSEFTAATLGQYFVHDIVHHLYDVRG